MNFYSDLLKKDQRLIKDFKRGLISKDKFRKESLKLSEVFLELIRKNGYPFRDKVNKKEYEAGIILTLHLPIKHLELVSNIIFQFPDKIFPKDVAFITDKLKVQRGERQVYGTQYKVKFNGEIEFLPIENEKNLNEKRRALGLESIQNYEKRIKDNMKITFPNKLKRGDKVVVVAPSDSLSLISKEMRLIADERFGNMGLKLSFGKHVEELDEFDSSSIESRVSDLHHAFSDKSVKGVFAVIGGFNCNQLLRYLNWDIIKNNPKVFIGYSDTTALQNAIYAKTGLVTYSGPAYSTFGQKLHFDYTLEYFKKCLLNNEEFNILPSESWSDDRWYLDQENRKLLKNDGWLIINSGEARGTILGANICTFNLLQGTEYLPNISDSILFLEDDAESKLVNFNRDLQSIIHLPNFDKVKGIVIGRFQNGSEVRTSHLIKIIKSIKELDRIPVLANVDFGHTSPMITFPIGGKAQLIVSDKKSSLKIVAH